MKASYAIQDSSGIPPRYRLMHYIHPLQGCRIREFWPRIVCVCVCIHCILGRLRASMVKNPKPLTFSHQRHQIPPDFMCHACLMHISTQMMACLGIISAFAILPEICRGCTCVTAAVCMCILLGMSVCVHVCVCACV